jgi:hypothetical protein
MRSGPKKSLEKQTKHKNIFTGLQPKTEGKVNPHTYDYKPEWITFWNELMKELFKEELTNRRNALKSKYKISDIEELIPVTPVILKIPLYVCVRFKVYVNIRALISIFRL